MPSGGDRDGRILVLGGGGMLGHKMFQTLSRRFANTWCTLRARRSDPPWCNLALYQSPQVFEGVDAADDRSLSSFLREIRPAVIVNAVGAIKQRPEAQDPIGSITINALLPHRLGALAQEWGGRLIHFSTDCVFSGNLGQYTEASTPDATDLYGRTKHLGEVATENALTLRTSFIGREWQHRDSLLEWFLSQNHGRVKGFTRVWWSGVTTNHLADVVVDLIEHHPRLSGIYQLSSGRISKYDLLVRLRDGLGLDIGVESDNSIQCDRSLDGSHFAAATGYHCPSWETLIAQIADDPTHYSTNG